MSHAPVDLTMIDANSRRWIVGLDDRVLVTGAGGFIGVRVVNRLLELGFRRIRCFVRPSGDLGRLREVLRSHPSSAASVEVIEGNLLSRDDCAKASAGAAVIFHLAAGIDKSFAGCFMNSVLTTRNLLDAAVSAGSLKRFVNTSSFAVYSNFNMPRGAPLSEATPLETIPSGRHDAYGFGKLKQDRLVEQYHHKYGVPFVILRPGSVYGPGKPGLSGRIGIDTFGVFLHMGGSNRIPLTYVDNCADAIVLAGVVEGVDGQVFNVVDDDLPTSRRFLKMYKRRMGGFLSIPVPYPIAYFLSALWEKYSDWSQGQLPPNFNRRRCSAEWKGNRYPNEKLKELLGWTPRVPFDQASKRFLESLTSRS
jgi:nucleoside-diphosphate-sugar epimerase